MGSHLKLLKIVVRNPCQISPLLTIHVPLWFIIISMLFFYFIKLLFSGFLQLKDKFEQGHSSSSYCDWGTSSNCFVEFTSHRHLDSLYGYYTLMLGLPLDSNLVSLIFSLCTCGDTNLGWRKEIPNFRLKYQLVWCKVPVHRTSRCMYDTCVARNIWWDPRRKYLPQTIM